MTGLALRPYRDKEVRLFAACILADLMRVYAPDAPYDDDTFKVMQSGPPNVRADSTI